MTYVDQDVQAFVARITKALAEQPDFGIPELMNQVNKHLHTEASSILVLDVSTDELVLKYAVGPVSQGIIGLRIPIGQGVVGWVAKYSEDLIVPSTDLDPRFYGGVDEQTGFVTRSILCVPIVRSGRARGVFEVINKTTGYFNDDDVVLLREIVRAIADFVIKP